MVSVQDSVMSHSTQEEYDQPYVLHLWPTVLLRNLLPYEITYSLMVSIVSLKLKVKDLCYAVLFELQFPFSICCCINYADACMFLTEREAETQPQHR